MGIFILFMQIYNTPFSSENIMETENMTSNTNTLQKPGYCATLHSILDTLIPVYPKISAPLNHELVHL